MRCIRNARTWKRLQSEFDLGGPSDLVNRAAPLLRWACACGLEQSLAELLRWDNLPTKELLERHASDLFLAVKSGNPRVVELLAHAGANLNLLDNSGRSPISLAASVGSLDIVEVTLLTPKSVCQMP